MEQARGKAEVPAYALCSLWESLYSVKVWASCGVCELLRKRQEVSVEIPDKMSGHFTGDNRQLQGMVASACG